MLIIENIYEKFVTSRYIFKPVKNKERKGIEHINS